MSVNTLTAFEHLEIPSMYFVADLRWANHPTNRRRTFLLLGTYSRVGTLYAAVDLQWAICI